MDKSKHKRAPVPTRKGERSLKVLIVLWLKLNAVLQNRFFRVALNN